MNRRIWCIGMALLVALSNPAAAQTKGEVRGSYVNVRQDGKFDSPVIAKKLRGDRYTVLFSEKGWEKVTFEDGTGGWIFKSLLERKADDDKAMGPDVKKEPAIPALPAAVASDTKVATKDAGKSAKDKTPDKTPGKDTGKDKKAGDKTTVKDGKTTTAEAKTPPKPQPPAPIPPGKVVATSRTPEELYNLAIEQYEKKNYAAALETNQEALKQAPRNAEILNNLANCLFKTGKVQEAITHWKQAMEISPKSAKICNNLGIAYYQLDENDRAVEFYKKAVLFEPQFPDPHYNLASVYGFKGQFQEALEHYRKYLEFSPDKTMQKLTEERIEYCQKQLASMKKTKPAAQSKTP